jgi:hypothetical protein
LALRRKTFSPHSIRGKKGKGILLLLKTIRSAPEITWPEKQSLHPLCTLKPYKLPDASPPLLDLSLTTIKITPIYAM